MADYWTQGSFAFRCTATELALLGEATDALTSLDWGEPTDPPSAALLAACPPTDAADPWSGLRAVFPDPDYPRLGADFIGEADPGDVTLGIASFLGMDGFEPEAIAALIQCCCPATLAQAPIGFEWASTCSKPRTDSFSGGWCAIFADRIVIGNTGNALAHALDGRAD